MTGQILLIVGIGLVLSILIVGLGVHVYKKEKHSFENSYVKKKFLTENEKHFYKVLKEACGEKIVICPQVSMGALLDVNKEKYDEQTYWRLKQKFAMKIIDYVLCDAHSLTPLLIVELDDKTHKLSKDINRDAYTSNIGLKTIRFLSTKKPTAQELKNYFTHELKGFSSETI